MMTTINDAIKQLEAIREEKGNILIRTQIQVMMTVDFDCYVEKFYTDDKKVSLDVCVVKGYVKS